MKTKYPKWFNASYKPGYKPTKPPETVWEYKQIHTITAHEYEYCDLVELPAGANCVTVHIDKDCDSIYGVQITFAHKQQVPNQQYENQHANYKKQLEAYNAQDKEWKQWKKVWDEEQKTNGKEQRLKIYEELKKEFENG